MHLLARRFRRKSNKRHFVLGASTVRPDEFLCNPAIRIREASVRQWGDARAVEIVGNSPCLVAILNRLEKFAPFSEPILITGESGTGKESIAQGCYLLGTRLNKPMLAVNCPQLQDGNMTASELFGHKKGSFTGAVTDRKGCFEEADGGVLYLDEIADLDAVAQTMLLRALSDGEIKALGESRARHCDVRVLAATNRPLRKLMLSEQFRQDLYFRLRYFALELPPLRERGDDWRLLVEFYLEKLATQYGEQKRFSDAALELLANYSWPGNIRELRAIVTMGYSLADGIAIEPSDFASELGRLAEPPEDSSIDLYVQMVDGGKSYWDVVYPAFMDRELSRPQVRAILHKGLARSDGSYQKLLALLNMPADDYQKFMDHLRHHRLKPGKLVD
jgi:transcriptional regulator with GAF, ATPase, and Fis domain